MKDHAIFRSANLPEDEGNISFVLIGTAEFCQQWVAEQKGGYFFPSDYFIVDLRTRVRS